ncbi:hypothetical protein CBR_g34459 [Chara braunii]|uniref:Myb-like domain-containing protein n=1 Tax=Chara braunii TaxID=69332 RepID=A0A388LIT1_CHABU|nr:hypothetical protein CBR_g34459 [Chara braunii]|eukprot:GBG82177.1 hypothetical protein CBR_g34459 [Chara braunii]
MFSRHRAEDLLAFHSECFRCCNPGKIRIRTRRVRVEEERRKRNGAFRKPFCGMEDAADFPGRGGTMAAEEIRICMQRTHPSPQALVEDNAVAETRGAARPAAGAKKKAAGDAEAPVTGKPVILALPPPVAEAAAATATDAAVANTPARPGANDAEHVERATVVADQRDRKRSPFTRSSNWSHDATLALVRAKQDESNELHDPSVPTQRLKSKWAAISEKMASWGEVRDASACKKRWNNLIVRYRKIVDHQKQPGQPSFWELTPEQRKGVGILGHVERDVFDAMDALLVGKQNSNHANNNDNIKPSCLFPSNGLPQLPAPPSDTNGLEQQHEEEVQEQDKEPQQEQQDEQQEEQQQQEEDQKEDTPAQQLLLLEAPPMQALPEHRRQPQPGESSSTIGSGGDPPEQLPLAGLERRDRVRLPFVRSSNWSHDATMALVRAKREEAGELQDASRAQPLKSSAEKWGAIAAKMAAWGVVRDATVCKKRWNNLIARYRKIVDHQKRADQPSFWDLTAEQRKSVGALGHLDRDVFEALDSFIGPKENGNANHAANRNGMVVEESRLQHPLEGTPQAVDSDATRSSDEEDEDATRPTTPGSTSKRSAEPTSSDRSKRRQTVPGAIVDLTGAIREGGEAFATAYAGAADRQAALLDKQAELLRETGREQSDVMREMNQVLDNGNRMLVGALAGIAEALNAVARSIGSGKNMQ